MGAPLNEGVLRFGATQEGRESLRRERSSEVEKEEGMGPQDHSLISDVEISQGAGGEGGEAPTSSTSSASGEGRVQHHSSARRKESDEGTPQPGTRSPAEDGSQNQREAALAQHAAEQHGKREQGRQEGDRSVRSTRDMMGRVDGAHGGGEKHEGGGATDVHHDAPSAGKGGHAGGSSSAGSSHGAAGGTGSASHGGKGSGAVQARGGGSHAPASSGSQAPRIGGDVLAAVVGSGLTSVDDVAPGAVADDDPTDIDAEQVDSSQEATQARLREQELKTQKTSGLGAGLNFGGDGERGRHFDESPGSGRGFQNFNQRPGQGTGEGETSHDEQQGPAGEQAAGGSGSDERQPPPREAALAGEGAPVDERATDEPTAERTEGTAPSRADATAEPEAGIQAGQPERSAQDGPRAEPVAAGVAEAAPPAVEVPSPPPLATSAVPSSSSPDRLDRSAPANLGIDWMADTEYFFFDDARHTAEEAPGPAA